MTSPRIFKCPRCKTETAWEGNPDRPFCSEKCRLIDLGRWADGEYRIPTEDAPMSEENVIPLHPDKSEE